MSAHIKMESRERVGWSVAVAAVLVALLAFFAWRIDATTPPEDPAPIERTTPP